MALWLNGYLKLLYCYIVILLRKLSAIQQFSNLTIKPFGCLAIILLLTIQPISHLAITPVFADDLSVTIRVGQTTVTFSGKTSPNAQVTFMEDEAVIGTTQADTDGNFSKSIIYFIEGTHTVDIYATDSNNRTTSTVSYSLSLTLGEDTSVSNIILPPTIALSGTGIAKGDKVGISGLSAVSSTITIFVTGDTAIQTTSAADGSWSYDYDTDNLTVGNEYNVYAKTTTTTGYQSEASTTMTFKVQTVPTTTPAPTATTVPGTTAASGLTPTATPVPGIISLLPPVIVNFFDPDGDGRIESEEIYTSVKLWVEEWRGFLKEALVTAEEKKPKKCDLNADGICNLVDLSVLLFYIGK